MLKTRKTKLYFTVIILVAAAILAVVGFGIRNIVAAEKTQAPGGGPSPTPQVVVQEVEKIREVEKLVEVEKEISAEILQDGLKDMGFLVTEEYYFTEVASYSSIKTLFSLELPFSESSYLVSYDGIITAGIDFTGVRVVKDEEQKRITVFLPQPQIQTVSIDPESFVLHHEKQSILNPTSVADYNDSLIELERSALDKALERGLLDQAGEHARLVVQNFVGSLVDLREYRLSIR